MKAFIAILISLLCGFAIVQAQAIPAPTWIGRVCSLDTPNALRFSVDDARLFVGTTSQFTISTWDVQDGTCVGSLGSQNVVLRDFVQSNDGSKLIGYGGEWCGAWNLETEQIQFEVTCEFPWRFSGIAVSPNSPMFLVGITDGSYSYVRQYSTDDGHLLRSHGPFPITIRDIAAHPNGSIYAVRTFGATAQVREAESGNLLRSLPLGNSSQVDAAFQFSTGGSQLIADTGTNIVRRSWQSGAELSSFPHLGVIPPTISASGAIAISRGVGVVRRFRVSDGALLSTTLYAGPTWSMMRLNREGDQLAISELRHRVLILNAETLEQEPSPHAMGGSMANQAFMPENGRISLSSFNIDPVLGHKLIDSDTTREISDLPSDLWPSIAQESPDGAYYALVDAPLVRIVRSDTFVTVQTIDVGSPFLTQCYWSKDMSYFVTYGVAQPLDIWNTSNWSLERSLDSLGSDVEYSAMSDNSAILAVTTRYGRNWFFDRPSGLLLSTWSNGEGQGSVKAFVGDGSLVLGTGPMLFDAIWNWRTGELQPGLNIPGYGPWSSSVLADGQRIGSIARSTDNSQLDQLVIWDLHSGNPLQRWSLGRSIGACRVEPDGLRATVMNMGMVGILALESATGALELEDYGGRYGPGHVSVDVEASGTLVETVQATLLRNGRYRVHTATAGPVSLYFKWRTGLRKRVSTMITVNQPVQDLNITLTNGDVDNDNEVGPGDFGALSTAFGSRVGDANWSERADLTGDGVVEVSDFEILARNFGLVGD